MSPYTSRAVDPLIDRLLAELPALLIVRPRAAGNTTTAAHSARMVAQLDREAEAVAFRAGILFHTGPRAFALAERVAAVPISALWASA